MYPSSPHESRKLAELAEANSTADFYRAAPPSFAERYGLYLEQTHSYTATLAKDTREFERYNRVFALGVAQPTTEEEVDHLANLFHHHGLPCQIRLSPDAQPPELPRWLEVRGWMLEQKTTARFFFQPAEPLPHSHPFRIRPVEAAEATTFAQIACFGHSSALQRWLMATMRRSGWHHYLAFEEETPIASGVLYIQEGIGWLGWAVTLPAHRRKGAQQALLVHRLNEALRMGCTLVSAETRDDTPENPNPSYHNLFRLGFQLAYHRLHYRLGPLAASQPCPSIP